MPEKLKTPPEQNTEQEQPPEGTEEEQQEEPEVFTREYVEGLRDEAAQARLKAKQATTLEIALREAVISKVAAPILQDTSALQWSDEFNDAEGMPDPTAIRAAAEELAKAKPTLARVGGDVLQGHRGGESDAGAVDLGEWIRSQV